MSRLDFCLSRRYIAAASAQMRGILGATLSRVAGRLGTAACRLPGGLAFARNLRARSTAIVMYHGVTAVPLPAPNWCQIDVSYFEEHIKFLSQEYVILPLRDIIDLLHRGADLPRRAACLTFDDGFRNVATTAFPILQRYGVPATVFLITSLVETGQPAWPDRLFHDICSTNRDIVKFEERYWSLADPLQRAATYTMLVGRLKDMTDSRRQAGLAELERKLGHVTVPTDSPLALMGWEDVERLAASGLIDFGSHTHTHPILSRCPQEQQREELARSRQVLLERLGQADLFAFPNGRRVDFTPTTLSLLRELGYRCGLTTVPGLNRPGCNPYELCRVNVGASCVGSRYEALMIGI